MSSRWSSSNSLNKSPIVIFSLVVLFWTLFDSVMTYIVPLLIEEQGYSTSMIGLIIGTSSVTGAFFDFIICKVFKNTSFKRIFLVMFALCFVYPILLWQAKTIWLFLFAMAIWGIYFDLYGFGVFNLVGRYTKKINHSGSFGTVQMFRSLGVMLAPIIVGMVVIDSVDWRAFGIGWLFLSIGFIFFIILLIFMRRQRPIGNNLTVLP